jgi:hypothetical protein
VRAVVAVVALMVLVGGCLQAKSTKGASPSSGPPGIPVYDNTTVEGVLHNSPHLRISSGMTLQWEIANATREKPGIARTMILLLDDYKTSHHAFDGTVDLVAFIPVLAARDQIASCASIPKEIKTFLRRRRGSAT